MDTKQIMMALFRSVYGVIQYIYLNYLYFNIYEHTLYIIKYKYV